ncbi:MAG: Acylphosphatase [Candidatus Magasanikbacteria bacterium GW2011_GWC2_37_14]|uniref:Acylphosphatase n=1 Tax=Candidatus Magasanikbacteria bacterium GW2011_GWC2_37_14 TaxID=1619046 RepID=A0A0G0JI11_9BACT|nr:MAG: Acylphosphatase [Candidatus Magasanikbacteria bacterium GW2011_GWC2_37_14]
MYQLNLTIHGRVQGVGFRWSVMKKAKSLGLVGYVKNLVNGIVEVLVEGDKEDLKKLLEYCKIGPLLAHVEIVGEKWESLDILHFKIFEIRF